MTGGGAVVGSDFGGGTGAGPGACAADGAAGGGCAGGCWAGVGAAGGVWAAGAAGLCCGTGAGPGVTCAACAGMGACAAVGAAGGGCGYTWRPASSGGLTTAGTPSSSRGALLLLNLRFPSSCSGIVVSSIWCRGCRGAHSPYLYIHETGLLFLTPCALHGRAARQSRTRGGSVPSGIIHADCLPAEPSYGGLCCIRPKTGEAA